MLEIIMLFLIETISMFYTTLIESKTGEKLALDLADKGYIFNQQAFNECIQKLFQNKTIKNSLFQRLIYFVPIINIIHAKIRQQKIENAVKENEQFNKSLKEMNENEKIFYDNLIEKKQKLCYISFQNFKEEDDEIIAIENNAVKIRKKNVVMLNEPALLPLSYNYEEVLKLNAITKQNLLCGICNNIKLAIIGIPDEIKFDKVYWQNDIHEFNKFNENEQKNAKYLVVPCTDEYQDELNSEINKIIEDREENNFYKNVIPMQKPMKLVRKIK